MKKEGLHSCAYGHIMVFSSITFLFFYLPTVLLLYSLVGRNNRNLLLLIASLFFYAWGEGLYVLLMVASIIANYTGGRVIHAFRETSRGKIYLFLTILVNLSLLGYFKYAQFFTENINILLSSMGLKTIVLTPVQLPIGISFFTFQALSYIIDVYRGNVEPQKNIVSLGLYISLFPQLIAGPIVRYHDISRELLNRTVTTAAFAEGIQRFLFGLSKKVLLANPIAIIADQIFAIPTTQLTPAVAWLGALAYTLQIYFDFSGYSDMAIGLGRMFGFHFLENFNYPYISKSIREFWQRWHISLSSWFRDYVYIALGGNRLGKGRTYLNLFSIFVLCGLWHGASWTFVIWGLYHGFFIVLERLSFFTKLRKSLWFPIQWAFTLIIIMFGWVIFRSDTILDASQYIAVMTGFNQITNAVLSPTLSFDDKARFEMILGICLATRLYPMSSQLKTKILNQLSGFSRNLFEISSQIINLTVMIALTYFTVISLAAGAYNPFIYFRF